MTCYSIKPRTRKKSQKIWIKTPILRSDLCDYSDAYIVVKRTKIFEGTNASI